MTQAVVAGEARWPSRPIRIVVAQASGGPPDLIARFIAEPLGRALSTPVVVDNRPGASGIIGAEAVARAAPDGYTLLIATLSTHALVPNVTASVAYDPVRDFAPVANLFRSIKVVWVTAGLPVATLTEFINYAATRPGQLNFASGGVGSSNHVDAALFNAAVERELVHVPYNGPSAAIAAVASGEVDMMIVSITTGIALAQARRIRPLAVLSAERSPLLPEVPTSRQSGLTLPDTAAWIGLVAPAGTPREIVDRLNAEVVRVLQTPEALAWAQGHGLEIVGGSPAAFGRTLAADYLRWGNLLRDLGLAPR
ncbi:MAG: tripartite tricarboxylate transporter substrate binding protein [Casimicrobiaceae bacterium]